MIIEHRQAECVRPRYLTKRYLKQNADAECSSSHFTIMLQFGSMLSMICDNHRNCKILKTLKSEVPHLKIGQKMLSIHTIAAIIKHDIVCCMLRKSITTSLIHARMAQSVRRLLLNRAVTGSILILLICFALSSSMIVANHRYY